jgi:hypothetical protein
MTNIHAKMFVVISKKHKDIFPRLGIPWDFVNNLSKNMPILQKN